MTRPPRLDEHPVIACEDAAWPTRLYAYCCWSRSIPTPPQMLRGAGFEVESLGRALDEDELIERARRRRPARHPVQDAGDRGACSPPRPQLLRDRRVLHRHRPDRPAPPRRSRRRRVQRAVLQHPQRRRARHRRDHRADPPADREERRACTPASGTRPPTAATRSAAARSASSATATSAPSCRCWPRTSACASTSTTPPTSSRWATPAAATRWTSCSRRPTS